MYAIICLINRTAINKADTKYNRLLLQGDNRVYSIVVISNPTHILEKYEETYNPSYFWYLLK